MKGEPIDFSEKPIAMYASYLDPDSKSPLKEKMASMRPLVT